MRRLLAAALLLVPSLCWSGEVVLPKCCPLAERLVRGACLPNGTLPQAQVHGTDLRPLLDASVRFAWEPLHCSGKMIAHNEDFWILEDGRLSRGDDYPLSRDYCLEHFTALGQTLPVMCSMAASKVAHTAFVINSVGYLLSVPFALATILVYLLIKDLRTLHGKVLICVLSMFVVCCLFLSATGFRLITSGNVILCTISGYAVQFFFMATFFWLNVMCFDIYWAFSGLKKMTGSAKERERKKLILYSLYAWGFPLVILLITLAIDYSPGIPTKSPWKPNIGFDRCFFKEDTATELYFYLPMGLIIIINIVLFSITAYRICTLRRETAVLKRGDSRKHDSTNDKERFTLYLKLFVVMGINWVMELVSFLVGGPNYLWYIPDFTNTLQGVIIFGIFVCKKRVLRLIWAKMRNCCGKKPISSSTKTPWTASTRNHSSNTASSGMTHNGGDTSAPQISMTYIKPKPKPETNGTANKAIDSNA